ncbi:MAG: hypothetical protein FWC80_03790 [Firmicutes bacterium]|nr:hypothetical protein [Bacillota bacterium]
MNITRQDISIDGKEHPEIIFLRVMPENMQDAILLVLRELSAKSWLAKLDNQALQKSFDSTSSKTVTYIENKIKDESGDNSSRKAGQYLVSHLAKRALTTELAHEDIPLMELLSRRVAGAEGFDFYSEKLSDNLIICGEAKFVYRRNPYDSALSQIKEFIDGNKHIDDISLICHFTSKDGQNKMTEGQYGVCSAFSTTSITTDELLKKIITSDHLASLFDKSLIILVGVDVR